MREVGKTSNGKVLVEMTPEELASVAKLLDLADILWPPLDEEAAVRRVKLFTGSPVIDDLKKLMQVRDADIAGHYLSGHYPDPEKPGEWLSADEWANRHGATVVLPDDESEG